MKKFLALALASTITLFGAQSADAANPKSGAACTKVNQKVNFADKTFTCVKKGSKLVWNAGVASAKPAANKGASEGFLCTEGSAPTKSANGTTLYCTKGGDGKSSWRPQAQQGSGGGTGSGGGGSGSGGGGG